HVRWPDCCRARLTDSRMAGRGPPILSIQARSSLACVLFVHFRRLRGGARAVERHPPRGLLPEGTSVECATDDELDEEVARLLHSQFWALLPQGGAHYRISTRGHVR